MATMWTKMTEAGLILALNIALPTVDVYTDLALIVKFLTNGHPGFAGLLLVPFLLNYFLSWILWWRIDKRKCISWIAALLGCYPQFYAANIIRMLWADFDLGMKKKRKLERNISEFEVFAESVLTVLVITYIWVKGSSSKSTRILVIGEIGSSEEIVFFLAYATSVLTASLGLAKCLKNGPCRVLGEGGALGGLISGRFLLLMISVAATLVGKGIVLAFTVNILRFSGVVLVVCTMFLPGLLLALMSLCHYKKIFKTILSHPSLLLMPVFTNFTFTVNNKCCTREESGGDDTRIMFSKKWTLVNIAVSAIGHVGFGLGINSYMFGDNYTLLYSYFPLCLPIAVVGFLFTLLFLFVDQCCRSCCICIPEYQKAVLRVNDPLTEYVVDKDTEEGIITFQEWNLKRNGNSDLEKEVGQVNAAFSGK